MGDGFSRAVQGCSGGSLCQIWLNLDVLCLGGVLCVAVLARLWLSRLSTLSPPHTSCVCLVLSASLSPLFMDLFRLLAPSLPCALLFRVCLSVRISALLLVYVPRARWTRAPTGGVHRESGVCRIRNITGSYRACGRANRVLWRGWQGAVEAIGGGGQDRPNRENVL